MTSPVTCNQTMNVNIAVMMAVLSASDSPVTYSTAQICFDSVACTGEHIVSENSSEINLSFLAVC